ncbi:hypothetical protein [Methylobacterium sp. 391_Methyba4]|uniref:hypothetical protein n=1 Tax=Methylobacterium sp. 391_Methyba4 TaxID=3038924 RepID=UPI00241CE332|nr:hypothetical protein [Methylobacterium sp. 391_Methyba4]WFS05347.1 hypothetical protein P9K36_18140 [Methylobacterium sp. 391_Methyba4]
MSDAFFLYLLWRTLPDGGNPGPAPPLMTDGQSMAVGNVVALPLLPLYAKAAWRAGQRVGDHLFGKPPCEG